MGSVVSARLAGSRLDLAIGAIRGGAVLAANSAPSASTTSTTADSGHSRPVSVAASSRTFVTRKRMDACALDCTRWRATASAAKRSTLAEQGRSAHRNFARLAQSAARCPLRRPRRATALRITALAPRRFAAVRQMGSTSSRRRTRTKRQTRKRREVRDHRAPANPLGRNHREASTAPAMQGERLPLLPPLLPGTKAAARRLRPPRTVEARPQPLAGPDGGHSRHPPAPTGRAKVRTRIRAAPLVPQLNGPSLRRARVQVRQRQGQAAADSMISLRRPAPADRARARTRIRAAPLVPQLNGPSLRRARVQVRRPQKQVAADSVAPLRHRSRRLPIARSRRLARAAAIRATRAGHL